MRWSARNSYRIFFASSAIFLIAFIGFIARDQSSVSGQSPAQISIEGQNTATGGGGAIMHSLVISNGGSSDASLMLSATGSDWPVSLPAELSVAAKMSETIAVEVGVPVNAENGEINPFSLHLESAAGESILELEMASWTGGRVISGTWSACRFDLSSDGQINVDDTDAVEERVGAVEGSDDYSRIYDLDGSGEIDRDDVELVADAIGQNCESLFKTDTTAITEAVTVERVRRHLEALQEIADDHDGRRSVGTSGFAASVDYVVENLQNAGYEVEIEPFDYQTSSTHATKIITEPLDLPANQIRAFGGSALTTVTSTLQAVDLVLPPGDEANTSTTRCEPEDFEDFEEGKIALIQRGSCFFSVKVANAVDAGAAGIVMFNEGQPNRSGLFGGGLAERAPIPIIRTTFGIGNELAEDIEAHELVTMSIGVEPLLIPTMNVHAETAGGRADRLVVVGGHLDSVYAGPGINDNGSGTMAILETAIQFAELEIEPVNKVRFTFWGAEEVGLVGSRYYVGEHSNEALADIMLNLNYDMIGSPNFFRGVYDGDGDGGENWPAGPSGSAAIEWTYSNFFESRGLAFDPTPFSGRSDYGPFIQRGVPAGGLFTGAEGNKSERLFERYGGTQDEALDPCYHRVCDTIDNINWQVMDETSDAAAHSALIAAMDTYIPLFSGRLGSHGVEGPGALDRLRDLMLPWLGRNAER